MADINDKEQIKNLLVRPIQFADQISKIADEAYTFRQECQEIKSKTEKLAALLRQAARASNVLYERPTRRIIDDTEQVLDKTLALVLKCRNTGLLQRMFTIIPAAAFRKSSMQLENSIGDVSWLLRVSAPAEDRDDEYLGLPPIASNEPILCLIWEQVAILYTGSVDERSDAAASLVSLARDNDRYGKLIIEEGGVSPLLKLLKEGKLEGQENAARAIGLLGRDPESVEHIMNSGACTMFEKILKDGNMKIQAVVAWAISELAGNHPKCQDHFMQCNAIRYLVSHLAFETIQEHSRYAIAMARPKMSVHQVLLASQENNNTNNNSKVHVEDDKQNPFRTPHPMGNQSSGNMHELILAMKNQSGGPASPVNTNFPTDQVKIQQVNVVKGNNQHNQQHITLGGTSLKGRDHEDPATKAQLKAMAARALWKLCKGNISICRSITESKALLCFGVLLEKGRDEVQSYSALALMEITAVAEQYSDLRRSAFKPTSPAAKAVVDQILSVVEKGDSDLLIPCISSIGNLARTFRATETRMIGPLVKLLDEREPEVSMEAAIALTKFACTDNFLHDIHCKAIINAGGAKHLVQLVYFAEQMVQIPSLVLLCYIALHVPDNETLAQEEVLIVLEWATKQAHLNNDPSVESILLDAKSRLELYQSRGSRGFF